MTWHYQICTIFCSLFEDERVNCIKMKTVFALFCLFVTVFGSNTEINLNFKGLLSGLGEQEEPQPNHPTGMKCITQMLLQNWVSVESDLTTFKQTKAFL